MNIINSYTIVPFKNHIYQHLLVLLKLSDVADRHFFLQCARDRQAKQAGPLLLFLSFLEDIRLPDGMRTVLDMVLWWNYVVTILEYGTLVFTNLGEVFGGILSVTILL